MKNLTILDVLSVLMAVALLLCLTHLPYGYFVFIRYAAMILGIVWAVQFWQKNRALAWTSIVLAGLFQPFFKLALGRTVWNVVDVVVAILLIILVVRRTSQHE